MSEAIKDGGPAFPTDSEHQVENHVFHFAGMTLRDWFAGQALASGKMALGDCARCYEYADAMLAARAKP